MRVSLTRRILSDTLGGVQLSDFMQDGAPREGLKVRVRVPTALRESLGTEAVGEFRKFKPAGRRVLVVLKVGARLLEFRPQDVIGAVESV